MKQIRKRLTYANVMSSIAIFLVIGGGAAFAAGKLAKNSVGTKQLKKNAVTTKKIKNGAVTGAKLANGSVTNEKLGEGAVTGNKVAAGTIGRGNLAEGALLPRAFALVNWDGKVEPNFTNGLSNATTPEIGAYCFHVAFTPIHVEATGEADTENNDVPSVALAGTEDGLPHCNEAEFNVEVDMWDTGFDEETEEEFFVVVW